MKKPGRRAGDLPGDGSLWALLFLFPICSNCIAAGPGEASLRSKSFRIVRAETPPILDGRLDDEVWERAAVVDDFHEVNPNEYGEPSVPTRVLVLYDDHALYVAARLYDADPDAILDNVLIQGTEIFSDDSFSVVLDPFNQGRSGYVLALNPNGIRHEALYANTNTMNWDWNGIWHGKGRIDAEGWMAEMAIPFKTLSFDPSNETWGINFARVVPRRKEWYGWVSYNRSQDPSSSGLVTGLKNLSQGKGLDFVPSLALREKRDFAANTDSFETEPSVDLFYRLTPALTASLTANPDFSGTDVDERQVNLTRFGLFFPEQRDFFLQDADIFEFARLGSLTFSDPTSFPSVDRENGRPFFSRRVGLSVTGEPVDLNVGGKLTGRIGRFDVGLLDIQQDSFGVVDQSNLFVGRAAANVLAESSLGVIVTNGDPRSNLDNSLVGIDFRYFNTRLPGNRTLEGAAWYQQSDTQGVDADDQAFGLSLKLPSGTGLRASVDYRELQRNFNPALGFVNRTGVEQLMGDLGFTRRPNKRLLRTVYSGIELLQFKDLQGNLQTRNLTVKPFELESSGGDKLKSVYTAHKEVLSQLFEISPGVVIPVGTYTFDDYGLELVTGSQRVFSGSLTLHGGNFFDGERTQYGAKVVWRPSKHFRLGLKYNFNDIELPQGSFITRLMEMSIDFGFTATWAWENFIQYDNVSDSVGFNSIVRWIPVAGREIVLVLNRSFEDFDEDGRFHTLDSELALKLSYTFRF